MFSTIIFILCFPPVEAPKGFVPSLQRAAYVLTLPDYIDDSKELYDSLQKGFSYNEAELSYIVNSCIAF